MAGGRLTLPSIEPVVDSNGNPVAGAVLTVYANRTTSPVTLYTDQALTTPAANPQTGANASNAAGYFYAQSNSLWVDDSVLYTVKVVFPTGQTYTYNDFGVLGGAAGALTQLTVLTSNTALAVGHGYYCDSSGGAQSHTLPALSGVQNGQAVDIWGGQSADTSAITITANGADTLASQGTTSTSIQITTNDVSLKLMKRAGAWQVLRVTP